MEKSVIVFLYGDYFSTRIWRRGITLVPRIMHVVSLVPAPLSSLSYAKSINGHKVTIKYVQRISASDTDVVKWGVQSSMGFKIFNKSSLNMAWFNLIFSLHKWSIIVILFMLIMPLNQHKRVKRTFYDAVMLY